jgi:hypothetical protein
MLIKLERNYEYRKCKELKILNHLMLYIVSVKRLLVLRLLFYFNSYDVVIGPFMYYMFNLNLLHEPLF